MLEKCVFRVSKRGWKSDRAQIRVTCLHRRAWPEVVEEEVRRTGDGGVYTAIFRISDLPPGYILTRQGAERLHGLVQHHCTPCGTSTTVRIFLQIEVRTLVKDRIKKIDVSFVQMFPPAIWSEPEVCGFIEVKSLYNVHRREELYSSYRSVYMF